MLSLSDDVLPKYIEVDILSCIITSVISIFPVRSLVTTLLFFFLIYGSLIVSYGLTMDIYALQDVIPGGKNIESTKDKDNISINSSQSGQ